MAERAFADIDYYFEPGGDETQLQKITQKSLRTLGRRIRGSKADIKSDLPQNPVVMSFVELGTHSYSRPIPVLNELKIRKIVHRELPDRNKPYPVKIRRSEIDEGSVNIHFPNIEISGLGDKFRGIEPEELKGSNRYLYRMFPPGMRRNTRLR